MDWFEQVKTRLAAGCGKCPGFVRTPSGLAAAVLAAWIGLGTPLAQAAPPPSAREILSLVRANEAQQNQEFTGRLRMPDSSRKVVVPFRLIMRGGTITYEFSGPPEALVLRMGEESSRLERVTGSGKTQTVTGAKLDDLVRGTDITYEDLALKFLYWNNARVIGEDDLMTRRCWVLQAVPSTRGESQYDMVRLWVEKSGGLMKAECYVAGKLAKRFVVRNVQRSPSGGGYILKTMKIQRMDERGKDRSPTYLEVKPV